MTSSSCTALGAGLAVCNFPSASATDSVSAAFDAAAHSSDSRAPSFSRFGDARKISPA